MIVHVVTASNYLLTFFCCLYALSHDETHIKGHKNIATKHENANFRLSLTLQTHIVVFVCFFNCVCVRTTTVKVIILYKVVIIICVVVIVVSPFYIHTTSCAAALIACLLLS